VPVFAIACERLSVIASKSLQASLGLIGGPFGDFSSASVFSFTAGIVRMLGKDLDLRS